MANRSIALVLFLGTIVFGPALFAGDDVRSVRIAKLRRAALDAVANEATTAAYRELFDFVNAAELADLTTDRNIGLALYARWQSRNSKDLNLVAASHPERFAGFLEGRTDLKCPAAWVSRLTLQYGSGVEAFIPGAIQLYEPLGLLGTSEAKDGRKSLSQILATNEQLQEMKIGPLQVQVPGSTRIADGTIKVGKKSIPVHPSVLSALRTLRGREAGDVAYDVCRVLFENGTAFMVFYCYGDESAPTLLRLDEKTGAVVWQSEGWARTGIRYPIFGSWSHHPIELVASDRIVALFGVCGSFVEGFDIDTGDVIFRFHPNLWAGPVGSYRQGMAEERAALAEEEAARNR